MIGKCEGSTMPDTNVEVRFNPVSCM